MGISRKRRHAFAWAVMLGAFWVCLVAAPGAYAAFGFQDQWGGNDGRTVNVEGIALDSSNDFFYTSQGGDTVQKFTIAGDFVARWGSFGSAEGEFQTPFAVAVNSNDQVYVLDWQNDRVQRFDSDGNFELMWGWGVDDGSDEFQTCTSGCQAGVSGAGAGQFNEPEAIAVDSSDNVYVADTLNNRISKFDPDGARLLTVGWGVATGASQLETCTTSCQVGINGPGDGQLSDPRGIDVDAAGNIYASTQGGTTIQKFDSSGAFVVGFNASEGTAGTITGVAVDSADNATYLADRDGHSIQRFNATTGAFEYMWGWGVQDGAEELQVCSSGCQPGLQGSALTEMNDPIQITTDNAGNVWGANISNSSVQVYSGTGSWIERFRNVGDGPGDLREPHGIAADLDGNVYVADADNNRVQKFSRSGTTLGTWAAPQGGGTGFTQPLGVTTDTLGHLYVGHSDTVTKTTTSGAFVHQWGSTGTGDGQFNGIFGLAADRFGNTYVGDYSNNRLQKFDPNGQFLSAWGWGVRTGSSQYEICTQGCDAGSLGAGLGQFSNPLAVAVDPNADIVYVANEAGSRVLKFTTEGQPLAVWTAGNSGSSFASGVSVDAGGAVYVADRADEVVRKYDATGSLLDTFGQPGTGPGEFDDIWGVAVNCPTGEVFASDEGSNRIERFGDAGQPISTCARAPSGGGGGGSGPDGKAPTLSLSLSPRRFKVSNTATKPKKAKCKKRKGKRVKCAAAGTTVKFTLDEPAAVRFTVERRQTGRKVGKSCKRSRPKLRKRKRCTLYGSIGSFTRQAAKGTNSFYFNGKLGKRKLRVAPYRLSAVATDAAGNRSRTALAGFRIARR